MGEGEVMKFNRTFYIIGHIKAMYDFGGQENGLQP
jgi:hypothetical protein